MHEKIGQPPPLPVPRPRCSTRFDPDWIHWPRTRCTNNYPESRSLQLGARTGCANLAEYDRPRTPTVQLSWFVRRERSERNESLLFRDHFEIHLTQVVAGAYRLMPDVWAENRKWATCADLLTWRRRDILMELIAVHLGTHHLLSIPAPVTISGITWERDVVPAPEVTVTDQLRVFVSAETTHPQPRTVTRQALNEIPRTPHETVTAVEDRLIDAFRASTVDCALMPAGWHFSGGTCQKVISVPW